MLTLQIKRWGNSAAIRIPNSVLQQLAWTDGETLQAQVIDRQLIISKPSSSVEVDNALYQTIDEAGIDVSELVNKILSGAAKTITSKASDETNTSFTLDELMKAYPAGEVELSEEDRAWLNMKPVGKEIL